ncbi:MAG: hypothetical protein AAFR17_01625 [Pseudomonadota bacterium]
MALTEYEIEWLSKTSKDPVTKDKVKEAADKQDKKEAAIAKMKAVLDSNREMIDQAQDLVLTKGADKKGLWHKMTKSKDIPWRASDEDVSNTLFLESQNRRVDLDADTREDIKGDLDSVPQSAIDALMNAFSSIKELERELTEQLDDEGNRLFSDDDIRRELYTPMVRDGLIPENMVPDAFSEEKRAFDGASEVYAKKIEDFSKKASAFDSKKQAWRIAKETVSVVGSIVSNSVAMSNAMKSADLSETARKGDYSTQEIEDAKKDPRFEYDSTDSATEDEQAKKFLTNIDKNKKMELDNQAKWAVGAAALASGALSLGEMLHETHDTKSAERDWLANADKTFAELSKMIGKIAVPATVTQQGGQDDDTGSTFEAMSTGSMIGYACQASLSGCRVGVQLAQIFEKEENKCKANIKALVVQIADTVEAGFLARSNAVYPDNKDAALKHAQIGKILHASIVNLAGNGDLIYQAIKAGKSKTAAGLLCGQAAMTVAASFADEAYDVLRKDVDKDEYSSKNFETLFFAEKTANSDPDDNAVGEFKQDEAIANAMKATEQAMEAMHKSIEQLSGQIELPKPVAMKGNALEELEDDLQAKAEEAAQKQAQDALKEHFTDDAVDAMLKDFDAKLGDYEKLYAAAHPVQDLDGTPDAAADAMAEIDRAIERTKEIRARVELINSITSAGSSVLATMIPGGGAVQAAQKIVYDIFVLDRTVKMHNQWLQSLEFAFASNSSYGPAIQKTCQNAQIHMSHASVKLVLDTLQLGAQIGKLVDPTGASAVASGAISISAALVDYGYKMHKEAEIIRGWTAYKAALDDPQNRKAARKALKMNSTLAKCCIAYGYVKNDPAAVEAVKVGGLSGATLVDETDVCLKLVNFLETQLDNDPVVMKVQAAKKKWHPAKKPLLTAASWFDYKAAACTAASPRMHPDSAKTPGIDKILADLDTAWGSKPSFKEAIDVIDGKIDKAQGEAVDQLVKDKETMATTTVTLLGKAISSWNAYKPLQAAPGKPAHTEMADITAVFRSLAQVNLAGAESVVKAIKGSDEPGDQQSGDQN